MKNEREKFIKLFELFGPKFEVESIVVFTLSYRGISDAPLAKPFLTIILLERQTGERFFYLFQ